MTPDDRLSAVLAEIRERNERRTFAANLTHAASADDVPRLLAALDAVLAEHCQAASEPGWCQECGFTWPCTTVEIITRALTGEAGDA